MTAPLVFLSKPGVLNPPQNAALYRTLRALGASGLRVFRLDRDQYSPLPWHQLRELIGRADAAVVMGFRQMSVTTGAWRADTVEAAPALGWYPTAWNQLEAGLAVMASLPVLVVPEAGINDGVFSADVWGGGVYGLGHASLNQLPDFSQQAYGDWLEAVHQNATRKCQPLRSRRRGARRLNAANHPLHHR
jgi:hypothetical protein